MQKIKVRNQKIKRVNFWRSRGKIILIEIAVFVVKSQYKTDRWKWVTKAVAASSVTTQTNNYLIRNFYLKKVGIK